MHGYFSPSKYNSNLKIEITNEEASNENFPDDQDTEMYKKKSSNKDKQNSSNSNFNYNSSTHLGALMSKDAISIVRIEDSYRNSQVINLGSDFGSRDN